jgi:uncharacterized protein (TIGR02444 family)
MASPFWNFSVAVYGANAVEGECLTLQDQFGIDVNLILMCTFVGAAHGVALTPDDIASARELVGSWHKDIVTSLRTARRRLKTIELYDADTAKAAADLRSQVKAAELESERIEQTILEQWAKARLTGRPRDNPRDIVPANLQTLLAGYGIGPERLTAADAMKHLVAAALVR